MIASKHADLTEEPHLVVEQIFLHDFAVLPSCNGAELQLEAFSGRVVHLAIEAFPRADHLALPAGDRARPIAGTEHHPIRIVVEVILDGLEEGFGLSLVCVATARGIW